MDEDIQASLNSKPFLPIAVGLIGAVIGAVALFIAINAAGRASTIEETYKNGLEKTAAITIEMEKISRNMEAIEANIKDVREVKPQIDALRRETQSAVTGLNNYIKANRDLIEKNRTAINELGTRSAKPAASAAAQASQPSSAGPAQASSGGTKHAVKAGENFSIIAKKYGKSTADIEKANPGIDSRRLQIGQEIIIP